MRYRRQPERQPSPLSSSNESISLSPRRSPPQRSQQSEKPSTVDPITRLVRVFSQVGLQKQWLVPLSDVYNLRIDAKLVGQTFVINGPAQSGKTSLIYWALRYDEGETAVVVVDCLLYRTEMQFIQKLARELGEQIGVSGLDRRAVAQENIKFSQLNAAIEGQDRSVVILIRNAERLVEYRKQILLYNLLEWVATDIKSKVGLVFTTRVISFVERFEKRVRSRLNATHLALVRPSAEKMVELLARRVHWLAQREREYVGGCAKREQLYKKVLSAIRNNPGLVSAIRTNQQFAQKDVVFFLNAMKLAVSGYRSMEEVMRMEEGALEKDLVRKLEEAFGYIFPLIPKNLLKTCSFPECIVLSIIYHMSKHEIVPYRFKKVYEVYLEFKQRLVTSEGTGSAFIYSKNVLERGVLKLEELKLIELENKDESVWNCDIRCAINHEEIEQGFGEIDNLPDFLQDIIKS